MGTPPLKRVCAIILAASAGLAGCSQSLPTPDSTDTQPMSNITEQGLSRILTDTHNAIKTATESKDPKTLESRLAGTALLLRQAQERIAQASGTTPPPMSLSSQTATVTKGTTWPRAIFNVSDPIEGGTVAVSAFRQEEPTGNYKLYNYTLLFPDVVLPKTSALSSGAQLIPAQATGFVQSPEDAVAAYVDFLNHPDGDHKDTFENDRFVNYLRDTFNQLTAETQEVADTQLNVVTTDKPITALEAGDGAALVAATIQYSLKAVIKLEGSKVSAGGNVGALLGDKSEATGELTSTYAVSILMVIPKADSGDKIRVIGANPVPYEASSRTWEELHPATPEQ